MKLKKLFFSPELAGKQGEIKTAVKLNWINILGKSGRILQNVYVPMGNGSTTEIDLLYITQKGIFVIESKNYTGYIFGSEKNKNWTVTLYAGKDWLGRKRVDKYHFYNPIWQNRTHIKFLSKYISRDIPFVSVIVFSDSSELKSIDYNDSDDFVVCNRGKLHSVIAKIWKSCPDILCDSEIEALYNYLLPLTRQTADVKRQHIQDVHKRENGTNKCPQCGGKLVLRTAKKGPNAGGSFYGCSNYPKCTFTKSCDK